MKSMYTPLDLHGSKKTFTGRSEIINSIFNSILDNRSVAIFGERQIGKTLLLLFIKDMLNDSINVSELIDRNIVNNIENWKESLQSYRAIYMDFMVINSEDDLINSLTDELDKLQIKFDKRPENISELFNDLTKNIDGSNKIIFLFDEMEKLYDVPNNSNIVTTFKKVSNNYSNILFIHSGSFEWEKKANSKEWNHLKFFFLGGIDENDAINYLIKPLLNKFEISNGGLNNKILEWSGSKPLLIQEICKHLFQKEQLNRYEELETELLDNVNIEKYIIPSIFEDVPDESKPILKFLCHKPNSSQKEIIINLKIKKQIIIEKLNIHNQYRFHTIKKIKNKYCLNGTLIEKFGKKRFDINEHIEKGNHKFKKIFRWIAMVGLFTIAVMTYLYSHPSKIEKQLIFQNYNVILKTPFNVESNEADTLRFYIQNTSKKNTDSLKLKFHSNYIKFSKNESNIICFKNLIQGETKDCYINYQVFCKTPDTIISQLTILPQNEINSFFILTRKLPFKRYNGFIMSLLSILGLLIPGKHWVEVVSKISEMISKK